MYRQAIKDLYKWKESEYRKPLIIEGARQVGKTWLMKEFGETAYENTVYLNFIYLFDSIDRRQLNLNHITHLRFWISSSVNTRC